jgi:type VI protein secretion system component VasK
MRRLGGFKLPELLKNTSEVELQTARLEHLCRLIVRDRRPYIPINGLLLLISLGSTDMDTDAQQTGEILQRDLAAVQSTLKVHCPIFALVCDLETLPGFREFIVRLPVRDRERRLGQRFPLAPEIDGEQLLDYVDSSVQWVCGSLLRDWVFKLFRVETPGRDDPPAVIAANANLYLLLDELRERQKRLGRVLRVAFARQTSGPLRFGGCYLAGTGHDPDREQALVAGLFRRLIDHQNDVSWTDQAMEENESAERVAKVGYGVLAGAGVAVVLLVALVVFGGRSHHS